MANKHKKNKNLQGIVIGTILVVILGLGVFGIFNQFRDKIYEITYAGQPSLGSSSAPVKVMEFGDFKCPVCKTFHSDVFSKLKKEFIDTGKVQFFFSNYVVLGEDSMTAAQAGEAIFQQDPASFWDYYTLMYENQKSEHQTWATPAFITQLVKTHIKKIDVNQLNTDLTQGTYQQQVAQDIQKFEKLGFRSVPTLFVNGKEVEALNYEAIKKEIEEVLQ